MKGHMGVSLKKMNCHTILEPLAGSLLHQSEHREAILCYFLCDNTSAQEIGQGTMTVPIFFQRLDVLQNMCCQSQVGHNLTLLGQDLDDPVLTPFNCPGSVHHGFALSFSSMEGKNSLSGIT